MPQRYQFSDVRLSQRQHEIYSYLQTKTSNFYEMNKLAETLDMNPTITLQILDDFGTDNAKKIARFFEDVVGKNLLFTQFAKIGAGKTRFNFWLAKELHFKYGYEIYIVNPDYRPPEWMHLIDYKRELPYIDIIYDSYPKFRDRMESDKIEYKDIIKEIRLLPRIQKDIFIIHEEVQKDLPMSIQNPNAQIHSSFLAEQRKIYRSIMLVISSPTAGGIPLYVFKFMSGMIVKPPYHYTQIPYHVPLDKIFKLETEDGVVEKSVLQLVQENEILSLIYCR